MKNVNGKSVKKGRTITSEDAAEDADFAMSRASAPELVEVADEHDQGGAIVGRGRSNGAMIRARLLERGAKPTHVGGSLPLLPFDWEREDGQQAYLVRYLGLELPNEDSDYDLIKFDVLDWERFDPKRPESPDAFLYKAQLSSTYALRSWAGELAKAELKNARGEVTRTARQARPGSARVGDVVILTYGGRTDTGRGQSKLKLFSVELVSRTSDAVAAA